MFKKSTLPAAVRKGTLGASFPKRELNQLDQLGTIIEIDESTEIIAEDTFGRECFVVVDGEFAVAGSEVDATIGSGKVAGELAMLTGNRRSASVVATATSLVYALPPREFASLLSTAPMFRREVVRTAAGRLGLPEGISLPAQFVAKRFSRN